MKQILPFFLLMLSLVAAMAVGGEIEPPDFSAFTKMRMDYAQRKDFSPAWKMEEEREAIIVALRAEDQP